MGKKTWSLISLKYQQNHLGVKTMRWKIKDMYLDVISWSRGNQEETKREHRKEGLRWATRGF